MCYFKMFFIFILFAYSISMLHRYRPPLYQCISACVCAFSDRIPRQRFPPSSTPMPIRTKSRAIPFSGADTAFPFLISADYF